MSFGLIPSQYFAIARDNLEQLRADPSSKGKAIHCVLVLNHLPEQIWKAYANLDQTKIEHVTAVGAYKALNEAQHQGLARIRAIANGTKHSEIRVNDPKVKQENAVDRKEVAFAIAGIPTAKNTWTLLDEDLGLVRALRAVPMLVVYDRIGGPVPLLQILEAAIGFWTEKFDRLNL